MSQPDNDPSLSESHRRVLSALADGDASHTEAAHAFQVWREDARARASWHTYQLIGDVLRSEDLAAAPAADAAFLAALRARLAEEPVVLAPQAHAEESAGARPATARSRGRWQGPVAMAAGFLLVIGGLNIVRPLKHAGPVLAATPSAVGNGIVATSLQATAQIPAQTAAQTQAAADQLAPYLAAHRQSTMSAPFQMPGSDIRNVSLVQPAR